jgi:hypothetical protein
MKTILALLGLVLFACASEAGQPAFRRAPVVVRPIVRQPRIVIAPQFRAPAYRAEFRVQGFRQGYAAPFVAPFAADPYGCPDLQTFQGFSGGYDAPFRAPLRLGFRGY